MVYQIFGIVILLAFYLCYFVKMIAQKRKGVTTDQMGKGKAGTAKVIEIVMKIATYLVPPVEVICIVFGTTVFPDGIRILGICIGIAGVVTFMISVLTMRDNWRAGVSVTEQTNLVTNGIYQISRNPAFLGFDLVYISILLMFFHWALFVVSVFAITMLHLQIVIVEEKFLIASFGDEYLEYKKKVFRYIGRKSLSMKKPR